MDQSNISLLDLPNEMLLSIFKKLDNMDVLYSLLLVNNRRLDTLILENNFASILNFILPTSPDDTFACIDPRFDKFCTSVLLRIHHQVKTLIVDSASIRSIVLNGRYPNLTELKLFNVDRTIMSSYFRDRSPLRNHIQRQITDLTLVLNNVSYTTSLQYCTADVYGCILKFFGNLKHLSIIGSYPHYYPSLELSNVPLTTFFSSTLNKLCIRLRRFEDCLALLDGRLKQLTTLIIVIEDMEYNPWNVYNMDNLPNLKCFSLTTSVCLTNTYDTQIPLLFRRMTDLEELTFYITIKNRTAFIDGNHIYNEILIHMPRLHILNFCISTDTTLDYLVDHLSKDDIQRTLSIIKCQEIDCTVNYGCSTAVCYVFSLPFIFEDLSYIGNTFSNIVFDHVRRLSVKDEVPFKREFFIDIARSFPLLEELCVINIKPQSSMLYEWNFSVNPSYAIVKYPNLISLRLVTAHTDYIDQFLNETKTDLPRLTELKVNYNDLLIVTENFTRNATWLNCMNIKKLYVGEKVERSKGFYAYFPLLEYLFFSY